MKRFLILLSIFTIFSCEPVTEAPEIEEETEESISTEIPETEEETEEKEETTSTKNPDTTAPVITILGNINITIDTDTDYTDAGATATDDIDGSLTAEIITTNKVNTETAGSYSVTYTVEDSAGNEATKIKTVKVVTPTPIPQKTLDVTFDINATWDDIEAELDNLNTTFDSTVYTDLNLEIPNALTQNISMDGIYYGVPKHRQHKDYLI